MVSRLLSFVLKLLSRISLSGGVLGLALGVALYAYHKQRKRLNRDRAVRETRAAPSSPLQQLNDECPVSQSIGRGSSLEQRLSKISSIVVSIGGVIIRERTPVELSTCGASLVDSAVEVIKEIIGLRKVIFFVCEVEDDIGQAAVSDALEHAGLVGGVAQTRGVPLHRVIFCNSAASKVSIVRQIEPSIYIDSDEQICKELCRFLSAICLDDAGKLRQALQ